MAASKRVWVRRLITWGVTAAVVVFLLTRYSASAIGDAIATGNWLPMIPITAAASVWGLIVMSLGDTFLFSAAVKPLPWWDVLRAKAGSSILHAVNHAVGQGAYGVWLARRTKVGVRTTVGVIAYLMMTDLLGMALIAGVAAWIAPVALPRGDIVRWVAPLMFFGGVLGAFLGPRILPRFIEKARLLAPWKTIGPGLFLLIVGFRALSAGGIMVLVWIGARAFGMPLPLAASMAYLPFIFIAGALPINVFGFGAVQVVWVTAFEPWAPGEDILAFQFLLHVLIVVFFVIRGLPFLPWFTREIADDEDD